MIERLMPAIKFICLHMLVGISYAFFLIILIMLGFNYSWVYSDLAFNILFALVELTNEPAISFLIAIIVLDALFFFFVFQKFTRQLKIVKKLVSFVIGIPMAYITFFVALYIYWQIAIVVVV